MASVTLEIQDALAVVTISNSPLNLFTWEMLDELSDIIDQVAAAPLRALLLKANGQHFSAGADVPAMFGGLSAHAAEAHLAKHIPLMARLQELPIPTIAAVRGLCLTAGLELVLRCDVLWASETAQFAQLEAMIGATTLLGGAQILCERAGPARAMEICYSTSRGHRDENFSGCGTRRRSREIRETTLLGSCTSVSSDQTPDQSSCSRRGLRRRSPCRRCRRSPFGDARHAGWSESCRRTRRTQLQRQVRVSGQVSGGRRSADASSSN